MSSSSVAKMSDMNNNNNNNNNNGTPRRNGAGGGGGASTTATTTTTTTSAVGVGSLHNGGGGSGTNRNNLKTVREQQHCGGIACNNNQPPLPPSTPMSTYTGRSATYNSDISLLLNSKRNLLNEDDRAKRRLVRRNLPFHQSRNILNLKNRFEYRKNLRWMILLYWEDWFHVMLRLPTIVSVIVLLSSWTGLILAFAGIYMAVDRQTTANCGLANTTAGEEIQWGAAFAFSLETCTTVGYGLPSGTDAFFDECPQLQCAIYFQMLFSMLFNAFLITFFYSRLSRSEARAAQVLFGNKAVVRWENDDDHMRTSSNGGGASSGGKNKIVFEVQLYDADSRHPLVEAHARLYAVKHHTDRRKNPQPMRILRPNDELGTVMFLSIPTVLTHHIDAYSPLMPPGFRQGGDDEAIVDSAGMVLREVDSYTAGRDGVLCPVCGETYGTFDRLVRHVRYNQLLERSSNYPTENSHQDIPEDYLNRKVRPRPSSGRKRRDALTYDYLRHYWEEMHVEILVLVEGIDPLISGTFQALQSYKVHDIEFGGRFARCLNAPDQSVDMNRFHHVIKED